MNAPQPAASAGFRADLEGLRGLAILLVLGFHAALPGIGGGFIGVDVFFVLSGYLITGLLLRERERTGTISLRDFYARRARRILPAAAVVLVLTLAASVIFLAPLALPGYAADSASAALSVSNYRFASEAMDYFSNLTAPSPFLHYWSLSVEEQFYLLWPALLLLAMRSRWPRRAAFVVLAVVLVTSLAGAIVWTNISAPWAFYSLPTRAWQLALGGLVAALPLDRIGRIKGTALAALGWLGLAAVIAGGSVLIDAGTPYPGVAALLPAGGSALVIAAGGGRGSPGALLAIRPMRFLGRISFSLYLVHWPLLVIPAASLAIGEQLPLLERLGLCGIAVVAAWVSWRFVEEPFHRGRRFMVRASRVIALGVTSILVTAAVSLGVGWNATAQLDAPGNTGVPGQTPGSIADVTFPPLGTDPPVPTATPVPGATQKPGTTPAPGPTPAPNTTPAPGATASPPPSDAPSDTPTPGPTPRQFPLPVADQGSLPGDVRPHLSQAPGDWERLFADGCELQYNGSNPPGGCTYGDPNGTKTVALVGDSTAGQWFPALDRIAQARHWKIYVFIKFACRFEDIPQFSRILQREYTECEAWLPNVVNRLQQIKPDLTIVSADRSPGVMVAADADPARQGKAMARLLTNVPGQFAIMVTTPQLSFDPPTCLAQNRNNIGQCTDPRGNAVFRYLIEEKAAAKSLGDRATIVNMLDYICPGNSCPSVLNGFIVWRDYFHLTATYAASLAPELAAFLPHLGP